MQKKFFFMSTHFDMATILLLEVKVAEPEPEWWSQSFGFLAVAGAGAGVDIETPGSSSRQILYILRFELMIWTKKSFESLFCQLILQNFM